MKTREKTLLKEEEVLGGFDKRNYVTERSLCPNSANEFPMKQPQKSVCLAISNIVSKKRLRFPIGEPSERSV